MRSHPGLHPDFLTADDAALIREFIAEKRASVGICTGRANMLSFTVIGWRRFIGPYRELTIGDVYAGIDSLKSGKSQKGKPFKQNTWQTMCHLRDRDPARIRLCVRRFSYHSADITDRDTK